LAPRPGDRPQSVAALRDVLSGRAALPRRVQAEPPPAWERTHKVAPPPPPVPSAGSETLYVPSSRPTAAPARPASPSKAVPVTRGWVGVAAVGGYLRWPKGRAETRAAEGAASAATVVAPVPAPSPPAAVPAPAPEPAPAAAASAPPPVAVQQQEPAASVPLRK